MIRPHAVSQAALLCTILWTSVLCATDFSSYRGFKLGSTLGAVIKQAGLKSSDVRLVHQRPAVTQELEWRPGFASRVERAKTDPVSEGLLRFYNGELFQIISTYDRQKVEGMVDADMVEAISKTYGTAVRPGGEIAYHSNYGEAQPVIARWENSEYSYSLVRTGDLSSFALILSSKRLDALAEAAIGEAVRLDAQEAPERELDRQKKLDADSRLVLDKARAENVPNFRP